MDLQHQKNSEATTKQSMEEITGPLTQQQQRQEDLLKLYQSRAWKKN